MSEHNNQEELNHKSIRLCHVVKREHFDGYGFNLHAEKGKPGQYIGKVDDESPASEAGLCEGDRIIEVNSVNIGNETHKQVVQRIKAISNEVRLLVVDPDVEISKDNQIVDKVSILNDVHLKQTARSPNNSIKSSSSPLSQKSNKETTTTSEHHNNNVVEHKEHENIITPPSPSQIKDKTVTPPPPLPIHHSNGKSSSTITTTTTNTTTSTSNNNNNLNNNNVTEVSSKMEKIDLVENNKTTTTTTTTTVTDGGSSVVGGGADGDVTTTTTSHEGLKLPMTAAEMRAKLAAKKKYDPKNDSVDVRRKYDIIQKL